jgi:hypothetical protein
MSSDARADVVLRPTFLLGKLAHSLDFYVLMRNISKHLALTYYDVY